MATHRLSLRSALRNGHHSLARAKWPGRLGAVCGGYGPTKALAAALEPERRESLKRDFIACHDGFKSELGVAMLRDYLVTIGIRK